MRDQSLLKSRGGQAGAKTCQPTYSHFKSPSLGALTAIFIGCAAALLSTVMAANAPGKLVQHLEDSHYDDLVFTHAVWRRSSNLSKICIVGIDSSAVKEHGPLPWPRRNYAKIIRWLKKEGARVIAVDLLFDQSSSDLEGDRELAKAAQEAGNVVWACGRPGGPQAPLAFPIPALRQASPFIGNADLRDDDDGVVRALPVLRQADGRPLVPFAVAVAQAFYGRRDARLEGGWLEAAGIRMPMLDGERLLIRYRGQPMTVAGIGANGVLDDDFAPEALKDVKGRIAIVGVVNWDSTRAGEQKEGPNRPGAPELVRTPYTGSSLNGWGRRLMDTTEVQAHAVLAMLDRQFIYPMSGFLALVILMTLSSALSIVISRLPLLVSAGVVMASMIVYCLLVAYLFLGLNIWLHLVPGLLSLPLTFIGTIVQRRFPDRAA